MNELKRILRQLIETQTSDSEYFGRGRGFCYMLYDLLIDGQLEDDVYVLCEALLEPYLEGA